MRKFKISIGHSRFETSWKNKEFTWEELLERLEKTKRTTETHSQYLALPKDEQGSIKDCGGFVGGWIKDGHRKRDSVICRSLITLDIDFAKADFWAEFCLFHDIKACIYSTHKHSLESPRFRLIVPLDRDVTPEEYEAIARKFAEEIGIDQFDDTTYQPSRLMYWPTTSSDGVYFFEFQEGSYLCADDYLGKYNDWSDAAEWPASSRQAEVLKYSAKKQGDPLEKRGIVGAFCRAYSIEEAIQEFLYDVYIPCAEGRYTYSKGSTSGGLVIYDDKFAYSNHSTDPAGGKLCNAFDLIRIHLFGTQDEFAKKDTPSNRLPSYLAMSEFATKDDRVKEVIGQEHLEDLKKDYPDLYGEDQPEAKEEPDESEDDNGDWKKDLETDRRGKYLSTINNAYLIIKNDPLLKGLGKKNLFKDRLEPNPILPWKKATPFWEDTDDAALRLYLEKYYGFMGKEKIYDASNIIFEEQSYHPVRDFLKELVWDGVERLDTLLIKYLGAEDNAYVRAVTRKTFAAAVARVMEPGIKFDFMLTLVGPQGVGKSTLIKKMAIDWYSDTITTVTGKEAYENLEGIWIVEMAELTATRKAEVESVKQFISKQEDTYRKAFNRRAGTYRRQNIFVGTTNSAEFLRDMTGNRRWWPVDVRKKADREGGALTPFDLSDDDVRQIWAEAKKRYEDGEPLYLNNEETEGIARTVQESHSELNVKIGMIREYLNTPLPDDWAKRNIVERRAFFNNTFGDDEVGTRERTRVCVVEILCELFGIDKGKITKLDSIEVADCLRKIEGWKPFAGVKKFGEYGAQKGFYKEGSRDDPKW